MGHKAVDAQQLVAVAQALALGIHQQQNGPTRMLLHRLQNRLGLCQSGLYANSRMVGGADHGDRLALQLRRAAEDIAIALNRVFVAKQGLCQCLPVHTSSTVLSLSNVCI